MVIIAADKMDIHNHPCPPFALDRALLCRVPSAGTSTRIIGYAHVRTGITSCNPAAGSVNIRQDYLLCISVSMVSASIGEGLPYAEDKAFMKSVFEASTGLEAHMILNLLQQHGIPGRIEGEYLQGGVGELQALGFVRVLVSEADCAEAGQIINEWESIQPEPDSSRPEARPSAGLQMFFVGVAIGAGIMYWILKGPAV